MCYMLTFCDKAQWLTNILIHVKSLHIFKGEVSTLVILDQLLVTAQWRASWKHENIIHTQRIFKWWKIHVQIFRHMLLMVVQNIWTVLHVTFSLQLYKDKHATCSSILYSHTCRQTQSKVSICTGLELDNTVADVFGSPLACQVIVIKDHKPHDHFQKEFR